VRYAGVPLDCCCNSGVNSQYRRGGILDTHTPTPVRHAVVPVGCCCNSGVNIQYQRGDIATTPAQTSPKQALLSPGSPCPRPAARARTAGSVASCFACALPVLLAAPGRTAVCGRVACQACTERCSYAALSWLALYVGRGACVQTQLSMADARSAVYTARDLQGGALMYLSRTYPTPSKLAVRP
jgi:hypothetical protein